MGSPSQFAMTFFVYVRVRVRVCVSERERERECESVCVRALKGVCFRVVFKNWNQESKQDKRIINLKRYLIHASWNIKTRKNLLKDSKIWKGFLSVKKYFYSYFK